GFRNNFSTGGYPSPNKLLRRTDMSTAQELQNRETASQTQSEPTYRVRPAVDVIEREDRFLMFVEMPGVDHSQVDVTVEKNTLQVRGTAQFPSPEGSRRVSGEPGRRVYQRAFQLSDDIDRAG